MHFVSQDRLDTFHQKYPGAQQVSPESVGLGDLPMFRKRGESLDRPEDQTFQSHTETNTPATNGPDGPLGSGAPVADSADTQGIWNEHDKRIDLGVLPDIDSRTGL